MDLTVDDITTLFKFPQSKKHSSPMVSTPSGITIDSKLLQFTNTLSPINSVLPGIFISFRLVQEKKASSLIFLTPLGIVTVVKLSHSSKR